MAEPSRPLSSSGWVFWAAFAAGLALRLVDLDLRPLHHDEGVNGWFLHRMLEGHRWEYDPEQFHGPFLFYLGAAAARLLGLSEALLRLPVALASASMVLLLLPLRRRLGGRGTAAAAWLLAVSPSLVYYGRDLIHETYLAALTLALVAAASRWLEECKDRHLVLAALCLGLLFTVKETAPVTLAGLALGAAVAWWAAGRPPAGERGWGISGRAPAFAILALAAPYFLLYSSFFSHPEGLADSFRAYLPWAEKGFEGVGHEKPWSYFLRLLLRFEPAALAGAVAGAAVALQTRSPFGLFCAAWWLAQLALYSAIPYKTPWLALNIVLPVVLAAGWLWERAAGLGLPRRAQAVLLAAGLLAVSGTAARAVEVAFLRYDDERLDLVYVQAPRQIRGLLALLDGAAARLPAGQPLAVRFYTDDRRWPLPWYLRDGADVLYLSEIPAHPEGDVLICHPDQEQDLRRRLPGRYIRTEHTLRPRVELVVYVREEAWPGG